LTGFSGKNKAKISVEKRFVLDMVIFNIDLMTIPPDEIMSSKVDYTVVGGKIVFQRDGVL
jgi:predicted amidohydrolase YtcJ